MCLDPPLVNSLWGHEDVVAPIVTHNSFIIPWLHPIILELCLTPHDKISYCDWLPTYTQSPKTLDSIKCLADQLDGVRYSLACMLLRARLLSLDHVAVLSLFDLLHVVIERTTYPAQSGNEICLDFHRLFPHYARCRVAPIVPKLFRHIRRKLNV